jgi:hypothetical protein
LKEKKEILHAKFELRKINITEEIVFLLVLKGWVRFR